MQEKNNFSAGDEFDFGTVVFTEEDIIRFATAYDPLDFHLSKEAARQHFSRISLRVDHIHFIIFIKCVDTQVW